MLNDTFKDGLNLSACNQKVGGSSAGPSARPLTPSSMGTAMGGFSRHFYPKTAYVVLRSGVRQTLEQLGVKGLAQD